MTISRFKMQIARHPDLLIGLAVFAGALTLYIYTLAPGLVFGDPAEYTFVPHIWGISHPPGYAFQTVLGGVWQRLVPIGSIAYRANLLSAVAGAGIAALVYGAARTLTPRDLTGLTAYLPGLLAGLSAMTATDLWQHSIHANAHIVTALLATASLFTLLRWQRSGQVGEFDDGWLFAFCVLAGLSMTHHPLLVFSFPAYTAFILAVRPSVIVQPTWKVVFYSPRSLLDGKQWRILLRNPQLLVNWQTPFKMLVFALIGLSVWLYLPLRASLSEPIRFGPDNVNTIDGFLDLVLARGLRVNLFHFGLADQPERAVCDRSLLPGWSPVRGRRQHRIGVCVGRRLLGGAASLPGAYDVCARSGVVAGQRPAGDRLAGWDGRGVGRARRLGCCIPPE